MNWGSLSSFLSHKCLKVKLRVFLADHIGAMVTYCATNSTATCSPMIGQFFSIPQFWHQSIQSGYNDPSKSKSWKVLETVLSHLMSAVMSKMSAVNYFF